MSQSAISSYFITRKRGVEDDVIANKKKVICLERNHNSSESQANPEDSEEFKTVVVFPKAPGSQFSGDDEPKIRNKATTRQGITPQRRTTRSRNIHMQEVDGIETPKVVNFWKGGNLSPQKKSKVALTPKEAPPATIVNPEPKSIENASTEHGMSTPKKKVRVTPAPDAVEKAPLINANTLKLNEIKKKLKGSARLTELKTSLNKLQSGLDKLDQMESTRIAGDASRAATETPKTLKPFKSIHLEIMR